MTLRGETKNDMTVWGMLRLLSIPLWDGNPKGGTSLALTSFFHTAMRKQCKYEVLHSLALESHNYCILHFKHIFSYIRTFVSVTHNLIQILELLHELLCRKTACVCGCVLVCVFTQTGKNRMCRMDWETLNKVFNTYKSSEFWSNSMLNIQFKHI